MTELLGDPVGRDGYLDGGFVEEEVHQVSVFPWYPGSARGRPRSP